MRSFLAVLAGMVLWPALWLPFNAGVAALFPQHVADDGSISHAGILASILTASVLASLAAGFLTAKIARDRAPLCTRVLAVVQLAIGLFVQISSWHLLPVWYHTSFLLLIVPSILIGGRLAGGPTRS